MMDIISKINSMKFKDKEEESVMISKRDLIEMEIVNIVSTISANTEDLISFGFQLRKAD